MPAQARSAIVDDPAARSSRSFLSTYARQPIGRSAATALVGLPVMISRARIGASAPGSDRSKQLSTVVACSAKYGQ